MEITGFSVVVFAITVVMNSESSYAWVNVAICPHECSCEEITCSEVLDSPCIDSLRTAICKNFSEEIISSLPSNLNSLSITQPLDETEFRFILEQDFTSLHTLSVMFTENIELNITALPQNRNLLVLDLSNGVLRKSPSFFEIFPSLKILNISNNAILVDLELNLPLEKLEILDLSHNGFHKFALQGSLGNLHSIHLQNNQLELLPSLVESSNLKMLDISNNKLLLDNFYTDHENMETSRKNCAINLPSSIETLKLKGNSLMTVPNKECGLLAGLSTLKHLDLSENLLKTLSSEKFPRMLQGTLTSLVLDNNQINYLPSDAFDGFVKLKHLYLSNNYLRSIPLEIIKHIGKQLEYVNEKPDNHNNRSLVVAKNNPISCDCTQNDVLTFLQMQNETIIHPDDLMCFYPHWLFGSRLVDLENNDLTCYNVTIQKPKNTSCHEYDSCKVTCIFDGLPHPQTYWISPSGEKISDESLSSDANLRSSFSLSGDGHILTINDIRLSKTGTYRCVGNNSMNSIEGFVQVGVILAPVGSIVAIVVSAVSFMVAIVLNTVNLFHYYCQHLRDQRAKREQEAMSFKSESPIKSKRKGLHESEASLNANKYYRKYDFTCQQVFLDTVVKGAHTVKQTLYDARNSEFSANMWEYASHLRDRLHIELPSSMQFPRVSMPSISMPTISMPNISMPSMPNFQSINTNIERLGTSVMNRSHTLATSVGSVFTLRWLRSTNSDNESDSDLESAGISHVHVHVHKSMDEPSTPGLQSSSENSPVNHPKFPKVEGSSWLKRKMTRQASGSRDDTAVPRRTKSVRFSDVDRPIPSASHLRRSASYSNISSISSSNLTSGTVCMDQSDGNVPDDTIRVVCINVPETYQFETTV